jgi:HEAT repeat protein
MTMMTQTAQTPAPAPLPTLEQSFEALKAYKPADDPTVLIPIDQAVMAVHGNAAARAALEQRLAGYLAASYSSVTRSFVCRELAIIGSAASVPGLAPLVLDDELSVFARNALERIPGPEADKALRDAIAKSKGRTRVGIINSVAVRRDPRSVSLLVRAATEEPEATAAVAKALGEIGTAESAKALEAFRGKGTPVQRLAVADAFLICAERLIAAGERGQAMKLLETLTEPSQPAHVRLAANRAISGAQRR